MRPESRSAAGRDEAFLTDGAVQRHRGAATAGTAAAPSAGALSASAGLDHVTLTVTALGPAATFYDAVLAPLGLFRLVDYEDPEDEDEAGVEAIGYGVAAVQFWIVVGAESTRGLHLAFAARSRAAVDRAHTDALAIGAVSEHPPRGWQIYRRGRYAAMLRDPAGNLVEAFTDEH